MTTWELANEAQRQEILLLLDQLRRAGIEPPTPPASARSADLSGLTKRDAGTLTTLLRELWRERERHQKKTGPGVAPGLNLSESQTQAYRFASRSRISLR